MTLDITMRCDYCGNAMSASDKRAEVQVAEYGELHRDGYVIPAFRELHFHWECYETELPKTVRES